MTAGAPLGVQPEGPLCSVLHHAGGDHPREGVVAALPGGHQLHHCCADVLPPETGLQQLCHLSLLQERMGGGRDHPAVVSAIWVPPVMLLGQGGGCDAPPHTELSALQVPTGGVQTGGSVWPPPSPAHLKHLLYVAVFALQQLPPRGEVAVGEDPPGSQQAEGMVLLGGGRGGQRYPTPPASNTPHPTPPTLP